MILHMIEQNLVYGVQNGTKHARKETSGDCHVLVFKIWLY